jgi:uncharacterized membrane protein YphA (DoxX/SURF4 family)
MGFLKGRMEDYSSPLAGLAVRLYAGYFFLKFGLQKAAGGFGGAALRQTLEGWAAETRYGFYVPLMKGVLIPYAEAFAFLVTAGEILVGSLLLIGCVTRLAALVGIFLCLNFALASGVPVLSVENPVVFIVLLATVYATAAGRALGLDVLLKGRLPRWAA